LWSDFDNDIDAIKSRWTVSARFDNHCVRRQNTARVRNSAAGNGRQRKRNCRVHGFNS
jgi:hypothetical protein